MHMSAQSLYLINNLFLSGTVKSRWRLYETTVTCCPSGPHYCQPDIQKGEKVSLWPPTKMTPQGVKGMITYRVPCSYLLNKSCQQSSHSSIIITHISPFSLMIIGQRAETTESCLFQTLSKLRICFSRGTALPERTSAVLKLWCLKWPFWSLLLTVKRF